MNIHAELGEMMKQKFPHIKKWRGKPVKRKYAFEMPLDHGEH